MEKKWIIFERFIEPDGSIQLRKFYTLGLNNSFFSYELAHHYIDENPSKFLENIDYLILQIFTKEEDINKIMP